jgi:YD repeat-containing protein
MVPFFKPFSVSLLLVLLTSLCHRQYYYKDLIVTRQTADQWQRFKTGNVKAVSLSSFEASGQPSEGFQGQQDMGNLSKIITHTRTAATPESWIIAFYTPGGWPTRIVDSSDTYRSVSEYRYDDQGQLTAVVNTSTETDNHLKEAEAHLWQYDAKGHPTAMLKIKGASDTTYVHLTLDDKGNVTEEHATRNRIDLPTVYYYYDDAGHLTDIVRYNRKAARLLPDYVFEYDKDKLSTMLIVPEGSSDYQKWYYEYDEKGLKTKESCYNKQKELVGRIEYTYKF